jgi:DNA-binding transcriptional ArsR family regulator
MPTDQLSRTFAALADPIRRAIVSRLAVGDATVTDLSAPHQVSQQAISKHLRVLEGAGLVSRAGTAYRKPVHLEAEVFDVMITWIEHYRRQAEARYQRLDAVLAAMPDEAATETNPTQRRTTT